ncbi:MAG: redoxin domain-containing protein [Cyclobacteriaceae bacterium]
MRAITHNTYGILLVFLIGLVAACQSEVSSGGSGPTLSGEVTYPREGLVLLEKYGESDISVYDTIEVKGSGSFSQTIEVDAPGFFRLNFYDIQMVDILIGTEDLEIIVDGNNPNGQSAVTGSKDMVYFQELINLGKQFQQNQASLNQQFVQARNSGDQATAQIAYSQLQSITGQYREEIKSLARRMGNSLALMQVVGQLDGEKDFALLDSLGGVYEANPPDQAYTAKFLAYVEQLRQQQKQLENIAIGKVAPEIALPSPDGEVIKLSSLRGKIVLVDFWAQWCKPCRMENPNIVRVYNKYKDQGFEVFGVSLDRQHERWVQAIDEDGLDWTQVSDLKFWQSEAAQTYRVTAIPASFLLDEDGVIIAKNLRGPALEKKVAEVIG